MPQLAEHIPAGDWDSAAVEYKQWAVEYEKQADKTTAIDIHLAGAIAMLFQATKDHRDGKFDDVTEAASKVLIQKSASKVLIQESPNAARHARLIRAYVHYISGNFEHAIADCRHDECKDTAFAKKLLGMIYAAKGNKLKAAIHYREALKNTADSICDIAACPLLWDAYRKACKEA